MEWLNPRALWLLPLIALLFFFARRRRLEQRWVGNLYLWVKTAPPDPSQLAVRRLRRHWLIALQAAFMIAVIAALAHPVISSSGRTATFILDVSASMGARDATGTRLDLARERALATAAALPRRSLVRLIAAGPAPVDRGEYAAGTPDLAAALGRMTPTDGSAALADALNTAFSRDGADADVYVFTDQPAPGAMNMDTAHWVQLGRVLDNLAITALSAARETPDPAGVQVLVTVHNFGATAHVSSLELLADTAVVARASIAVPAGASRSVTLTLGDAPPPGVIHARLTTDDALAADNERWAIVPPNTPIRVRLITQGSAFLEKALTTNHALLVDVTRPANPDAAASDTRDVDVLVCDGCRALPARGPAVLVVPRAPTERPRVLDRLSLTGATHAVTDGIDLTGLAARAVPRVTGAVDGDVVARAGDAPAVVVSDHDGRRIVELNLDLSSSTLPLGVSFPLLLANVMQWLSGRDEASHSVIAGDPLVWPLPGPSAAATATGPRGQPVAVHTAGQTLTVTDTLEAGVYRVHAGEANRVFVVNPATATESDLSMTPDGAAMSITRPAPGTAIAGSRSIAWPSALLIAALLLLAIEWRQFCRSGR